MARSGDQPSRDAYAHGELATPKVMQMNWSVLTTSGTKPTRPAAAAHTINVIRSAAT